MKKLLIFISIVAAFSAVLIFNNCDEFDTLPINIPLEDTITVQGSNPNPSSSSYFCLSQASDFNEYRQDIQSLTFIRAVYITLADNPVQPQGLTGDLVLSLYTNNQTFFQVILPNVQPENYINSPVTLTLNQQQIQAITNFATGYLNYSHNECFTAQVQVNVTSGNPPYYVQGKITLIFRAEVNL